jgi:DNA-binding PadR family transcriptional regulator
MARETTGELEQLVLLALMKLGDEAYGATVRRELSRAAKRDVSLSTVYVTLMRLEEKGLVASWLGEPSGRRGGKAKRHFRIEAAGRRVAREARDVLLRMWEGIESGPAGADA